MIRLERLNKYSLFTAHGRRGIRTPVHAWGPPKASSHCAVQEEHKDQVEVYTFIVSVVETIG
jgi:hypothetical protein